MYSVTPFSPVLGSLPSPFSLLLGLLELLLRPEEELRFAFLLSSGSHLFFFWILKKLWHEFFFFWSTTAWKRKEIVPQLLSARQRQLLSRARQGKDQDKTRQDKGKSRLNVLYQGHV
jgi:hypothetical protein